MGEETVWMFDLVGTVIPIFIAVVLGILAVSAGGGLWNWVRNSRLPQQTVPARIVGKRSEIRPRFREEGEPARTQMQYYLTFELEDGTRKEFIVGGTDYGAAVEQDRGSLRYRGTRYLGFERERHYRAAQTW
ncbi:DUF2500 domain-containing protein [Paenibacillus spiritus]|uniref:DUF2500 domain-containing protein n=1 Tax=Paenibacillus spiritus TaxID=2496557 RepID=A0A5J5GG07_9BACL|nr:DUF2500 domain-containing protein [Paenibacillus spiritus]